MKFKVTSFHLIVVIVVQIIFIDALLASVFIRQLTHRKNEMAVTKSVSGKKSDSISLNMPEKKDTLLEFIEKTKLPDTDLKVFKIPDEPGHKMEFTATAYDLSYQSCGKYPSHPEYGITFSGKKAVKGRTVAVDPRVIPLGTVLYVEFPGEFSYLDGVYTAEDTGSKIKGNKIDIFLGESAFHEMEKFGSMRVYVRIIEQSAKNS